MEIFATIVMLAWIPAVLILFAVMQPSRAVIVAFLGAWLFLPQVTYNIPILPDYTKTSATCVGVFFGALLFDGKRLLQFKPRWVDLPVAIFCICPSFSSLTNGLGLWDGVSVGLAYSMIWGVPYLTGRMYFNDAKAIRELAIGVLIGGLLYVPLCLLEIRISPKLHSMVYGFSPREMQMRFGAWRPNVFMDGGLQVGLWMTAASLVGIWLWRTGAIKKLWGVPAGWLAFAVFATAIACRSTGATALLFIGLGTLWFCYYTRGRAALIALVLIPPTYIFLRASGLWHGEQIVSIVEMFNQTRADSLEFRIRNEDLLVTKALQKPAFGWAGWNRARVYDAWGRDVSITDGRWVIELGNHGILGAASGFASMLLPLALLTSRFPPRRLLSREMAPALALAMITALYAIDSLPNAMSNPVFMLGGGAVVGFVLSPWRSGEASRREADGNVDESAERISLRRLHPGSV
jgi:hypothetical protein